MSGVFTVIGAGVGFYFGGAQGAQLGASLGGAVDSSISASDQQRINGYNATVELNRQRYMQQSAINSAKIQFGLASLGAQYDIYNAATTARLNAYFAYETKQYEADLLRQEAIKTLEALDLSLEQVDKQYDQMVGSAKVAYTSAGVTIGRGDTADLVMLDMRTEQELEKLIMTRNGQENAREIMNAAARSRYEGLQTAMSILYQGQQEIFGIGMSTTSNILSGVLQTNQEVAAGNYSSNIGYQQSLYNSGIQANQTRNAGYLNAAVGIINYNGAYSNRQVTAGNDSKIRGRRRPNAKY